MIISKGDIQMKNYKMVEGWTKGNTLYFDTAEEAIEAAKTDNKANPGRQYDSVAYKKAEQGSLSHTWHNDREYGDTPGWIEIER
jgi:hypothetical protein